MYGKKSLTIFTCLILWIIFSVTSSIYSKEFLTKVQIPWTFCFFQSGIGTICSYFVVLFFSSFQCFNLMQQKKEGLPAIGIKNFFKFEDGEIMQRQLILLSLLFSFSHVIGTVLTNISTVLVSPSFTQTIKAGEPLIAVIASKFILNDKLTSVTYISLFIIVFGIGVACGTELLFDINGFFTAFLSNVCFVLRAAYVKKTLDLGIGNHEIFFITSLLSTILCLIPSIMEIYFSISFSYFLSSLLQNFSSLIKGIASHFLYNLFSFILLGMMSPLSHSVSGSVKRLFIIYSTILYFRNPVTLLNALASAVAVGGILLYR